MIVQCLECKKEIISNGKIQACGCSNHLIVDDKGYTANDLSKVVLLNTTSNVRKAGHLTKDQLEWSEGRKKRRIRKLTFEER
mgnify:FL=1|tara:strand:- start:3294 stop:3539 length:246 start_codon:yes stop_codon:yes gene_type:complete